MTKSALIHIFGACSLVAAGVIMTCFPSSAETPAQPVFAELFTSQGCSSCPAADQIWGEIQKRPDVVALSFSIDYWDYIGWKDTLASHENTLRQQAYEKAMPSRQVYTPQVIIDGVQDVVGNQRSDVVNAMNARLAKTQGKRVAVALSQAGNEVQVRIGVGVATQPATIWIAHTLSSRSVNVTRGENSGRVMTYWNIVRDFSAVGTWNGAALSISVPARGHDAKDLTDGVAVWIQSGRNGQVLGAGQIRVAAGK